MVFVLVFLVVNLSFNQVLTKDSVPQVHGLVRCVKDRVTFGRDVFIEFSNNSYLYFQLALIHSMSYCFPLSIISFLFIVSKIVSSNIDKVLSINPMLHLSQLFSACLYWCHCT